MPMDTSMSYRLGRNIIHCLLLYMVGWITRLEQTNFIAELQYIFQGKKKQNILTKNFLQKNNNKKKSNCHAQLIFSES